MVWINAQCLIQDAVPQSSKHCLNDQAVPKCMAYTMTQSPHAWCKWQCSSYMHSPNGLCDNVVLMPYGHACIMHLRPQHKNWGEQTFLLFWHCRRQGKDRAIQHIRHLAAHFFIIDTHLNHHSNKSESPKQRHWWCRCYCLETLIVLNDGWGVYRWCQKLQGAAHQTWQFVWCMQSACCMQSAWCVQLPCLQLAWRSKASPV